MISGDTIAAIATAPGRGGVAVVRVSGPEAFQVAQRLTGRLPQVGRIAVSSLTSFASSSSLASNTRQAGDARQAKGVVIDEAVVLAFKAPRSYTGEDVVEFQCHGGAVTPRRVLEACLAAGARLARRGEFTQRAFLNGRLDYDQAESVLDLVDAKTSRAADAALAGLAGRKVRELKSLYETALELSTRLEHALDVDEGELPENFGPDLRSEIDNLRFQISEALRRAREGKILRTGALVVLAGPPNVGKSSLMNALLEENRAIVSDVPGTTRDSIEEWMDLGGWPVRLVDTAGLRETGDAVESEGVRRAEGLIAKADVVIKLTAADCGDRNVATPFAHGGGRGVATGCSAPNPEFAHGGGRGVATGCSAPNPEFARGGGRGVATFLSPRTLAVTSKCDLGRGPGLNVSAKTGEGLEELRRTIVARLEEKVASRDDAEVTGHDVSALHEALSALAAAAEDGRGTARARREEDLVLLANAVRCAAERLGEAIGARYSEDMLDNLFSRFCVGK